ncbi:hypothetical protein TRVL_04948 [Trypanosoma vivax]|uniref:Uncharacterized protein n=1 Tax=Trypanosoma vivax (strain Y486) TaxID=1055687 RepID=G0U1N3_TRYVY|nr:hypothetical protein TRVL_04948 [Trypanosoma vivax]CCC49990.1 conserved hypothetical protein [Trypanosoma vivax Y486]
MKLGRALLMCVLLGGLLPVCYRFASSENKIAEITLGWGNSPVERFSQERMKWSAAWRVGESGEWMKIDDVPVVIPSGERVVTIGVPVEPSDSASNTRRLVGIQCEESRRLVGGFRRGRCSLQLSTCSTRVHREVFFGFRVPQKHRNADVTVTNPSSQTGKLYEENNLDEVTEVGSVTFMEGFEKWDEGPVNSAISLELVKNHITENCSNWLPTAVRVLGMSVDEAELKEWRRGASTTLLERWGYPLFTVLMLYAVLRVLALAADLRHRAPVAPSAPVGAPKGKRT